MINYSLRFVLQSDTTFGRGDGVAGLVDAEVQHDEFGLPYLGGRALKGLLGAECADILFALEQIRLKGLSKQQGYTVWEKASTRLFGESGSALSGEAILSIGPARLPEDLRLAVARDVRGERLTRADILDTLTALRRQTAMDAETGAPKKETLRTMRVILRETPFEASLSFQEKPTDSDLALLAACVKAFRRAGTGRTRGRGKLEATLHDANGVLVTDKYFQIFRKAVSA